MNTGVIPEIFVDYNEQIGETLQFIIDNAVDKERFNIVENVDELPNGIYGVIIPEDKVDEITDDTKLDTINFTSETTILKSRYAGMPTCANFEILISFTLEKYGYESTVHVLPFIILKSKRYYINFGDVNTVRVKEDDPDDTITIFM